MTSEDCISSDEFDDNAKPYVAQAQKKYSANGLWKINCENGVGSMTIDGKEASLIKFILK